jgi:hypothetical protein
VSCVGKYGIFLLFLHVSQTTDCKGGPGSTNTCLRTEMSVLVPGWLFILKGFIFKSWPFSNIPWK